MKLNLLLANPGGCLPGYANLDCFACAGQPTLLCDISDLSEYIDDAECDEIRAINVLSYFDANKVGEIITKWVSKLRHGGELVIGDVDILQVWKAYSRAEIDYVTLNKLLYGEQTSPLRWDLRKTGLSLQEVSYALNSNGLNVTEKKFESVYFNIRATRP